MGASRRCRQRNSPIRGQRRRFLAGQLLDPLVATNYVLDHDFGVPFGAR